MKKSLTADGIPYASAAADERVMFHKVAAADGIPYASAAADEHVMFHKVAWRIIPFLFLCYVVSFLDRINIGFAQLQMKHDLGFSDALYGLGAAVFYIGYVL